MLGLSLKRGEEKVRKNKWRKREWGGGGGVEKKKVRKLKKTQEMLKESLSETK